MKSGASNRALAGRKSGLPQVLGFHGPVEGAARSRPVEILELERKLAMANHRLQEIATLALQMELSGIGRRSNPRYDALDREYEQLLEQARALAEEMDVLSPQ
ncbi:hypothetical protein VSR69_39375 [Paraburkholderia phytofirmans]